MFSNLTETLINQGIPKYTVLLLLLLPIISTFLVFARYLIGVKNIKMYVTMMFTLAFFDLAIVDNSFSSVDGLKYALPIILTATPIAFATYMLFKKVSFHYLSKITVILSISSIFVLFSLYLASQTESTGYVNSSIVSILLLVIAIDTSARTLIRRGFKRAVEVFITNIMLALVIFGFISIKVVRDFTLEYPEIVILAILANFLAGKFSSLRLTEYFRFSKILTQSEEKTEDYELENKKNS